MIEKLLKTPEYDLNYRIAGKGKPVVLIHGFGEDGRIWDSLIDHLKTQFQCIVPDLPGSGKSIIKIWDSSMDALAGSVRSILDHEKTPVVSMIGHSMGGYIALAFAEKYGELLNGLGLFHSSAFADTDEKKAARKKGIQFISQHGQGKFLEQSTPNLFSDSFKAKNPHKVQEFIAHFTNFQDNALVHYYEAMMQRPDRTEVLKKFQNPVLFIMGEHDTAIPLADGLKQCHIPHLSYIHILKNSGHLGMIEEPANSREILQKFLQEL